MNRNVSEKEVSEKELLERLAALPREIRPGRDPWSGISARIEASLPRQARRSYGRRGSLAAIAASVLLVLFAVFTANDDDPDEFRGMANEAAGPPADMPESKAVPETPWRAVRWAAGEREYLAAFREFAALPRVDLPPPALENARAGWLELQSAEAELQAALRRHPTDRFLNDRMLELRSRQLDFLRQIVAVDRGYGSDMI